MRATARLGHGVATAALLVAAIVLGLLDGEFAGFALPFDLGFWAASFGAVGWIITKSRPDHGVGRVFLWIGTLSAVAQLAGQVQGRYFDEIVAGIGAYPFASAVVFGTVGQLWAVIIGLCGLAIALFPDGRFASSTIRWSYWVFAGGFGATVIAGIGTPAPEDDLPNPLEGAIPDGLADILGLGSMISGIGMVVMMTGVFVALLRGGPVRRRQLTWVVLGLLTTVSLTVAASTLPEPLGPAAGMLAFPPIALGVLAAVTRHNLYEIDRIVSRTVSYVVTIGLLGGLYAVVVVGSRSVLGLEGPLPVALWTLAAAFALFPLARRIQGWVDRRFFRSRYDSASVVGAFADEMRATVDRESLIERTESVVGETFQAESVEIWLAEEPA